MSQESRKLVVEVLDLLSSLSESGVSDVLSQLRGESNATTIMTTLKEKQTEEYLQEILPEPVPRAYSVSGFDIQTAEMLPNMFPDTTEDGFGLNPQQLVGAAGKGTNFDDLGIPEPPT